MATEINNLIPQTRKEMQDALGAMERDFNGVRTGKASPALVENLQVEYYGSSMKMREIAGITAPEPRLLVIQPWDQNALPNIEKAIQASSLGISPVNDGRVIRLPIPELSEERRQELTKMVKNRAEEARVEVRNVRRESIDTARKAEKASDITEDDLEDLSKQIQNLTDKHIEQIDEKLNEKTKELMEV